MNQKINFEYFYGTQADQFSFYRIPKILFQNDYFKILSSDAKILYGLMLDRMSLSMKNQWFDEKNRAYIYFSIEEIMELLNCGRNKAVKTMQELDHEQGIGLIEKRRQGFGKSNIIYVKTFMIEENIQSETEKSEIQKFEKQTNENETESTEVSKVNFKEFEKQTSRSPKNKLQEVYKTNSNYNNNNNTYKNENESYPILSEKMGSEENMHVNKYRELIKENMNYETLMLMHPNEAELIEGIYELILETLLCQAKQILIASNWYPAELVRSKFLKLNYEHIAYVMECLKKNTTAIKNIKKYLLAALFNAPTTMDGYYRGRVNHDLPQFVG